MKSLQALFFSSVILTSCSDSLQEGQYRAYLQDIEHGLTQAQQVGSATVTCSYRPPDLLIAQELAVGHFSSSPQIIDSLRHGYEGRSYFSLTLAQNDTEIENQIINNQTAFTQAVTYLNSTIAQDVYLSTPAPQADSVAALMAVYPRQYGSTGRSTVLLVFDTQRLNLGHGFTLTYHDAQFQLGVLRFPFAEEDIADLPALKF